MHKLSPHMQDRINSRLEYLDNIKDLVMHCRKIYDQMLATNQVRLNTKSANIKIANISTRFFSPLSQTILLNINGYHLKLGNIFSPLTNNEWLKLMKERRCFYYK